jgi:hypothetical protein
MSKFGHQDKHMNDYVVWVQGHPLLSAAIQFAVLGTLGELISHVIRTHNLRVNWRLRLWIGKPLAWALLGVIIKYGFSGTRGFAYALVEHDLLPVACAGGLAGALTLSVLTNVYFGPQMMAFHRFEDNLITGTWNWSGLKKAWWTLIWFWIPAHTITFSLPLEYQIGLAAIWSLILGIILGLTKPDK